MKEVSQNQGTLLIMSLIFLTSLWDFYHPLLEIRIFDFAVFALLLFIAISSFIQNKTYLNFAFTDTPNLLLICIIILLYGLFSIFVSADNMKSVFGIILCLVTFVFFYNVAIDDRTIVKCMNILLITNISFLLFQYLTFILTRQVFNPFDFLGIDVRLTGGNIFRPAGLFREPASFALMIFTFIIIRLQIRPKFDFLNSMGCLAILLSISLWGTITVLLLIMFWHWRSIILHTILGLIGIFSIIYWRFILDLGEDFFLINRLLNLQDDGSANERYGGKPDIIYDPIFWFGQGPNNENYQYFGGNGLGYIIATWGLIFSIVIFLLLIQRAPPNKNKSIAIFGLGLALTASTIWTMAYWWLWIALLFRPTTTK